MGLVMATTLYFENPACAKRRVIETIFAPLIAWGTFAGLFGSLVRHPCVRSDRIETICDGFHAKLDSLLGATLQASRYSSKSKHILQDGSQHAHDADVQVVSGIGLLTNNQVSGTLSMR
jgi:hypothetical protein